MSEHADELSHDELFAEDVAPVAEPAKEETVTPASEVEKEPEAETTAPTEKAQQQEHFIPKWRFDEVNERAKAAEALLRERGLGQQPQGNQPKSEEPLNPDNFQTYEEYVEARAAQAAEARFLSLQQQQAKAGQAQEFQQRIQQADESWERSLYEATQKDPALIAKLQNAPALRTDIQLMLKETENRVDVAKHLAENPALVLSLNKMRPDLALRTMVETSFTLKTANSGPSRKPASSAPNLDPVGKGKDAKRRDPYDHESTMEEFIFRDGKR